MCIAARYRYNCGHEYLEYYIHCPINLAARGEAPFEKCQTHKANIRRRNTLCSSKECQALSNSWACCWCKQGPNTLLDCEQTKTDAPEKKCKHRLCAACPGWDAFKKRQDEQRKTLEIVKEEVEEK